MADESGLNRNLEEGQPSSSQSLTTPNGTTARRLNLLLAEDNLPDALLVREAIRVENLPVEIHHASDGEKAVAFLVSAEKDAAAACPDVLILDLNLPKIDGLEVLQRVRASKLRDIPVLVVTSSDSAHDRTKVAKLGARYFRKPHTYEEFQKIGPAIKGLLEENGLL
jgi:DNA-binding response OmpR family regulator